jgi:hypothetical protein
MKQKKFWTNISIDSIFSDIGYEEGNVQLVCYVVNLMKNKMTVEELKFFCKAIAENAK